MEEKRRSLAHILCLDMQLETQVFLRDGSVWMVGLWRSRTPPCAPSLLPRRSASTGAHTNTHRGIQSHSNATMNEQAATGSKSTNEVYQQSRKNAQVIKMFCEGGD